MIAITSVIGNPTRGTGLVKKKKKQETSTDQYSSLDELSKVRNGKP